MPFQVIYVDGDGTLWDVNDPAILRPGVRDKLELWSKKYILIAWSRTGGEYIEKWCKYHKIDHFFKYFLSKPDGEMDDDYSWHGRTARLDARPDDAWTKSDSELFKGSREGE